MPQLWCPNIFLVFELGVSPIDRTEWSYYPVSHSLNVSGCHRDTLWNIPTLPYDLVTSSKTGWWFPSGFGSWTFKICCTKIKTKVTEMLGTITYLACPNPVMIFRLSFAGWCGNVGRHLVEVWKATKVEPKTMTQVQFCNFFPRKRPHGTPKIDG